MNFLWVQGGKGGDRWGLMNGFLKFFPKLNHGIWFEGAPNRWGASYTRGNMWQQLNRNGLFSMNIVTYDPLDLVPLRGWKLYHATPTWKRPRHLQSVGICVNIYRVHQTKPRENKPIVMDTFISDTLYIYTCSKCKDSSYHYHYTIITIMLKVTYKLYF